jgi:para-nitrobenzyl esterase
MKGLALLISLALAGVGSAQTFGPPTVFVRDVFRHGTTGAPAFNFQSAGDTAVGAGIAVTVSHAARAPVVTIDGGHARGVAVPGGYVFRGLPYAAPPTGRLRWRVPRPPAEWDGIRDATVFAPSCPQPEGFTIGPQDEDCLYLNVSTPRLRDRRHEENLPVLVWIHGGGFTSGAGRDYDPTKLVAEGLVVVTVNYRLGALGFLSHPALASSTGGPSGNYGLMDQQAVLHWVRFNIEQFGGDPDNVTIAGESAGGTAVLAHLVSRSSRGLFRRAIVESGSFALTQRSLASAEADGQAFASSAGCPDQTAECLRNLPTDDLVRNFPTVAIPGVVDGSVLTESIGTALAGGRFARVPILNGTNHDEERLFLVLGIFLGLPGLTVSGGSYVAVPEPITPESYRRNIAFVLNVTDARATAIAAEYPLSSYGSPTLAFSALVGDANFACPALQMDAWLSRRTRTFAYEFNDDAAPWRYAPIDPPVATHLSELPYIFDLPDAPIQAPLSLEQEALAASMRTAWANFAATGDPSSAALPWPSFAGAHVMSLVPSQPQVETDFASRHHCSFWIAR